MDDRLIVNQPLQPRKTRSQSSQKVQEKEGKGKPSFKEVMKKKLKDNLRIEFSKHARNRIISRDIKVSGNELRKLNKGVEKAEDKGARDSLIMVNKVAYIVSVENKTVITAIDDENVKENVFTNIDSAVFM